MISRLETPGEPFYDFQQGTMLLVVVECGRNGSGRLAGVELQLRVKYCVM
jgi:hypothetical protein